MQKYEKMLVITLVTNETRRFPLQLILEPILLGTFQYYE